MTDFNSITLRATLQVNKTFHSHFNLESLEVAWGIALISGVSICGAVTNTRGQHD